MRWINLFSVIVSRAKKLIIFNWNISVFIPGIDSETIYINAFGNDRFVDKIIVLGRRDFCLF